MRSAGLICGPTGGHLLPAYLVGNELQKRDVRPVLYTSDSDATDLLPDLDFPLVELPVRPWSGQSLTGKLSSLLSILRSCLELRSRLREHELLVSFGGYPAVPGLLVAWGLGLDVYFQEQNRLPGRTHRLFGSLSTTTFYGFPPATAGESPPSEVTGNPVRPPSERSDPWFDRDPLLVVFGGSQGSRDVSQHLKGAAESFLRDGWSIYYLTGTFGEDLSAEPWASETAFRQARVDERLHEVLPRASAVWSRAGAGTLSELIHYGLPALVFPFPHSTDDHQLKNARWVAGHGPVSVVGVDEDPSPRTLRERTEKLRDGAGTYSVPWGTDRLPQVTIAERILS